MNELEAAAFRRNFRVYPLARILFAPALWLSLLVNRGPNRTQVDVIVYLVAFMVAQTLMMMALGTILIHYSLENLHGH